MNPLFEQVTIVGVGLIGGSLGLALKERGLAARVRGVGRSSASLERARELGVVDQVTLEVASGVAHADLVVLATPVGRIVELARQAAPHLKPGALVIDVGSTKRRIVSEMEPVVAAAGGCFVGCHPLAGSERRSVEAAQADLFAGSVTVVTPTGRTSAEALARIEDLWQAVGSRVVHLEPAEHDLLLARTSHLPHLAAAALALAAAGTEENTDEEGYRRLADLVASGFRDTTRIAAGDPTLWRDIFLDNRDAVLGALTDLEAALGRFLDALRAGAGEDLTALLARAKEIRDGLIGGELARG